MKVIAQEPVKLDVINMPLIKDRFSVGKVLAVLMLE